eukprot:Amastigsp_a3415_7.p2 type:complete len:155 gc:universal Amastigsp_a3415_7:383-847(+)
MRVVKNLVWEPRVERVEKLGDPHGPLFGHDEDPGRIDKIAQPAGSRVHGDHLVPNLLAEIRRRPFVQSRPVVNCAHDHARSIACHILAIELDRRRRLDARHNRRDPELTGLLGLGDQCRNNLLLVHIDGFRESECGLVVGPGKQYVDVSSCLSW